MLDAVEEAAAADAKHGSRLRLENAAFLVVALSTLPGGALPAGSAPPAAAAAAAAPHAPLHSKGGGAGGPRVLRQYAERAAAARSAALAAYVGQQAAYAGLGPALPHPGFHQARPQREEVPGSDPQRDRPPALKRPHRIGQRKIRLITRIAFGFKNVDALITLAMLSLGGHRPALPGRN